MFKRITYDEWTTIVPIIGFVLTFGAFLIIVVRALFMKKKKRDHLANLPLEGDKPLSDNGKEKI